MKTHSSFMNSSIERPLPASPCASPRRTDARTTARPTLAAFCYPPAVASPEMTRETSGPLAGPPTTTPALPIAVVDDRRFDQHRSNELHPERPERLIAARAGLASTLPPAEQTEVLVRAVSDEEAERVHSSDYLVRLQRTPRTGWGHIDADAYFCHKTGEAAWLAAGGGVELSRALLEGRARRGIALLRPPGHHACPDRAMGFCLLNNIAMPPGTGPAAYGEPFARSSSPSWRHSRPISFLFRRGSMRISEIRWRNSSSTPIALGR